MASSLRLRHRVQPGDIRMAVDAVAPSKSFEGPPCAGPLRLRGGSRAECLLQTVERPRAEPIEGHAEQRIRDPQRSLEAKVRIVGDCRAAALAPLEGDSVE